MKSPVLGQKVFRSFFLPITIIQHVCNVFMSHVNKIYQFSFLYIFYSLTVNVEDSDVTLLFIAINLSMMRDYKIVVCISYGMK